MQKTINNILFSQFISIIYYAAKTAVQKNHSYYNKNNYYVFLVNKSEKGQKNGIMPFNRHFGFIFMENSQQLKANSQKLYHTIAHELAHGAFTLYHTFSTKDKGITKGSTYNLMDYSTKTPNNLLRKYQWYIIHNPRLSLFGGAEEEVSSKSDDFFFTWQTTDIKLDTAYHKDKLKILKKNDKVILRIYTTNNEIDIKKTNWIYNKKTIVKNADTCSFPISEKGEYIINIETDNDISLKLTINVYTEYRFVIGVDTLKPTDDYYHVTSNNLLKVKIFSLSGDTLKLDWLKDKTELTAFKDKDQAFVDINPIKNKDTYDIKLVAKISNDDEQQQLNLKLYDPPVVSFEKIEPYDGEFGFDNYFDKFTELKSTQFYDTLIINSNTYYVPWMSTLSNQQETIRAKFKANNTMMKDNKFHIQFLSSNRNLNVSLSNGNTHISNSDLINGKNSFDLTIINISTFANKGNIKVSIQDNLKEIGKINYYSKDTTKVMLNIVYVNANGINSSITRTDILNRLNQNSYNQALIQWEVNNIDTLLLTNYNPTLSSQTPSIRNRIMFEYDSTLNFLNNPDPRIYYLFLTNLVVKNAAGGELRGQAVALGNPTFFTYRSAQLDTYPHEIGHARGLYHIFKESNPAANVGKTVTIGSGSDIGTSGNYKTDNHMDYSSSRKYFFFFQWLILNTNIIR